MSKKLIKISSIINEISMGPFGSNIKVENFIDFGVPVLNGSNLTGFKLIENSFKYVSLEKAKTFRKAIAKKGDVIITHRGTLGQISYIPNGSKFDEYVISQSQFRVALNLEKVDPAFFVYYFHTNEGQKRLLANKCHVGVPALAQATTNFKLVEIPLPPLLKQQKIAKVLTSLDSKIELNNRINAELEVMAKTIYDYWFVQFDFPDANGKPYKSSGGKMVWNEKLKREIPERWEDGTLSSFSEIIGGSTPPREIEHFFSNKGTAWITPKDLSNNTGNKFITNGELDVTPEGIKAASLKIMPKGTILLSSRAPIGYLAISTQDITTNQGFKSFVVNNEYSTEYVYYTIKNLIPTIENNAAGSTFKEVSGNTLKGIKVFLPANSLIEEFTQTVKVIFQRQELLEKENQQLSSLRDWLLPMLMNGQVKVSEVIEKEVLGMVAEDAVAYGGREVLSIPESKKGFAKQVLGGKIVDLFKDDPNFTHIKFQKLQYLAEHIAEADLKWNYFFQAAGPHDGTFMNTIAGHFRKNQWFDEQQYKFIPLAKKDKINDYFTEFFNPQKNKLNKLFDLLKDSSEAETEIIATLYAVWNNRIIKKETITKDLLIEDFYKWSPRKQSYNTQQLFDGLEWLKINSMQPTGFGKLIKEKKGK